MNESSPNTASSRGLSLHSVAIFGVSSLIAGTLLVGGVFLIHERADATLSARPAPLVAVDMQQVERSQSYTLSRLYTGRIEPARQTDLAFELGGTVASIAVDEGAVVSKGQVVARLDTQALQAQLRNQQASKAALLSDLERARLALKRQSRLKKSGFSADEKIDETRLDVARTMALIEQVDAALSLIEINLSKARLIAPFDAQVGNRMIDEGAIAGPGSAVLTLFETSNPTVRIGLSPQHSAALSARRVVEVVSAGNHYSAYLLTNRPDVSTVTRTVDAQFRLQINGIEAPPFGEVADVKLDETIKEAGYWVPMSALSEGERGLWSVLVTVNDGLQDDTYTIVREQVELLHVDGANAYIQGSLPQTINLVKRGTHRVVAGQQVQLAQLER